MHLDRVGARLRRGFEHLSHRGQEVVARRRVGRHVGALALILENAEPLLEITELLQEVRLVDPAVDVAQVDAVVVAEFGLTEVPQVRDRRVQLELAAWLMAHCPLPYRPTTAHVAGNSADRVSSATAPSVDRLPVAPHERRQKLDRKAPALKLQDIHACFGVGLDLCHPADLPARGKAACPRAARRRRAPRVAGRSGSTLPRPHASCFPVCRRPAQGALRRDLPRRLPLEGRTCGKRRRLQVHVARHPALPEEDELLDHVDHDLDRDSPDARISRISAGLTVPGRTTA